MTTANLRPVRPTTDMRLTSTVATGLAPLAAVLLAVALRLVTRSWALGPILGTGLSQIIDLIAQIGLWLGIAWLIKRAFSFVLHYSDRKLRPGGGLRVLAGGRKLLIDLFGHVIFLGALFCIVGLVLDQPIGDLLATSGLVAASSALRSTE